MATVKNPCYSLTVNGIVGDLVHFKSSKYRNLVTTKPIKTKPIPHRYWSHQTAMAEAVTYYKIYYPIYKTILDTRADAAGLPVRLYMQKRLQAALVARAGWNPFLDRFNANQSTYNIGFTALKTEKRLTVAIKLSLLEPVIGYYICLSDGAVSSVSSYNIAGWTTSRTWSTSQLTPGKTFKLYVAAIRLGTYQILRSTQFYQFTT